MSHDQRTAEIERVSEVRTIDRSQPEPAGRFELSLPKIIAGALAAAGAAVASSWLGVAGTVLGAIVGSIIVPVGTALASRPLERSSQVIRETLPPLLPERGRGPGDTVVAHDPKPATRSSLQPHTGSVAAQTRRPIRWGMLAVSCLVTLVVGFGLLTAAEEVMGKSFSSLLRGGDSGTTVSRLVSHHNSGDTKTPSTPASSTPNTDDPSSTEPTTTAPTTEPTTEAPTSEAPSSDPVTSAPTSAEQTAPATGAAETGLNGGATAAPPQ